MSKKKNHEEPVVLRCLKVVSNVALSRAFTYHFSQISPHSATFGPAAPRAEHETETTVLRFGFQPTSDGLQRKEGCFHEPESLLVAMHLFLVASLLLLVRHLLLVTFL